MKRILLLVLCLAMLTSAITPLSFAQTAIDVATQSGYTIDPFYQPKGGSIVVDTMTGQVLWAEDSQTPWAPASVTKMMVMYLTYEAISRGEIREDTVVTVKPEITELSTFQALSNNYLPTGAEYTVSDLINLILFPSSAGATLFLVDSLGYTHGDFVDLMNQTAKDLGMINTHYYNAIGAANFYLGPFLPEGAPLEEDNSTTVADQAILASNLVTKHPQLLEHSKQAYFVLKQGTELEHHYSTYNYSLSGSFYPLEGMDGIKTGSSDNGAFNVATTAKRGDNRFVCVVFGVGDWSVKESEHMRSLIVNGLLNKAFAEYEYKLVLPKGEHEINGATINVLDDLYDTVPIGSEPSFQLTDNHVLIQADRSYMPGYEPRSVAYEVVQGEVVPESIESEPVSDAPSAPAPTPPEQDHLKKSILTISLYLGGVLLVLLLVRGWLLRKVRRRRRR